MSLNIQKIIKEIKSTPLIEIVNYINEGCILSKKLIPIIEIKNLFIQAMENDREDIIHYLLRFSMLKDEKKTIKKSLHIYSALRIAFQQEEKITYLLMNNNVYNRYFKSYIQDKNSLQMACKFGNIVLIKYIIESVNFTNLDEDTKKNEMLKSFSNAIKSENFKIIHFLLSLKTLKKYISTSIFMNSYHYRVLLGNTNVFKYLLTSPDVEEKIDLYNNKADIFLKVCQNNNRNYEELLYYIIVDYQLIYNDDIREITQEMIVIDNMLKSRDFNNKLNDNLQKKPLLLIKNKI